MSVIKNADKATIDDYENDFVRNQNHYLAVTNPIHHWQNVIKPGW